MKIGRLSPAYIGAKVIKQHWTDCYMVILDVGQKFVVGQIYDERINQVVTVKIYPREDDDWYAYIDVEKFIELMPVRGE